MANIRMISWNIQVYGPKKYGKSENNRNAALLAGAVIATGNANVVVLMELMSSIAEAAAFTVAEATAGATGKQWSYKVMTARRVADRESYAVLWQSGGDGAAFAPVGGGIDLASTDFPNNESGSHGRRAIYAWFKTTDTNKYFVVTGYHAPPNQQAILGVERLGQMPEIYELTLGGVTNTASARMLGGDYNLDLGGNAAHYKWLTDPVPALPPPSAAGQGAGTKASVADSTLLGTYEMAINEWGEDLSKWSTNAMDYRQQTNCIDNIFSQPAAGKGATMDVVAELMDTRSGVSRIAQKMQLADKDHKAVFPHADKLALPLSTTLPFACFAFLLYRYAVSDHLPVYAELDL